MSFRKARILSGKSVDEVKKHMGVTDAAVYLWETGATAPRAKDLTKLADFYNCTLEDLFSKDEESFGLRRKNKQLANIEKTE